MRLVLRLLIAVPVIYASWLAMLALHEIGHMLHARISGGRVVKVSLPLWGFSQTIVWPNPHELFVVWGGPIWGAAIPLLAATMMRSALHKVPDVLRFFSGFCLIANGAYIGAGAFIRTGDAGDMIRLGTPRVVMIACGIACVGAGLLFWHRTRSLSLTSLKS